MKNLKYVYVLTSSENDLYYEQCLMSLYSLRLLMPSAHVVVLTDNNTFSSFTGKRGRLKDFAEIISIDFPETVSLSERSRLIKTSIPEYISGDFLYLDCDTIIAGDLSKIQECPSNVAGVLDGHVLLSEHIHKKYFLKRDKKLGFSGTKVSGFNINGGVIFARDCDETRKFFRMWNEMWKYSAYKKNDLHDQSALNEANFRTGLKIAQLEGEWNCQPSHGGLAYLKDAKIIHYYSSEFSGKNYIPYYKLADPALQLKIKEEGFISDDIKQMIANPKFQFNRVHLVSDKRIIGLMQSPLLFTLADIQEKVPLLFNALEGMTGFIRSVGKSLKGKK